MNLRRKIVKNAVYFQSGGPTSVINTSFLGVIKKYQENDEVDVLYGSKYGIQGLIDDNLILIDKNKDYSSLSKIPGAILGSARVKLSNEFDKTYYQILDTLKKHSIEYIFINGGNDSMDTGNKLLSFLKKENYKCQVVGICKTIDNDLEEMDFSPGFPSAVNYIVKSIMEISLDTRSYKKGRVTIVETMGRDAGWLCASSFLANDFGYGPDLIYLPEVNFNVNNFLEDVKKVYQEQGRVLVCVSEALKDNRGNYIFNDNSKLDSFGHTQLGSISKTLCDIVKEKLNYPTRAIEFNLMQRCSSHIQSKLDTKVALECGENAYNFALDKKSGVICVRIDNGKINYRIENFEKIANRIRRVPLEFISEEGNGLSKKGKEYFEFFKDDSLKIDIPEDLKGVTNGKNS